MNDQKKEKERVLRAIEEKKRIFEEYRKKNQQLEERMVIYNYCKSRFNYGLSSIFNSFFTSVSTTH